MQSLDVTLNLSAGECLAYYQGRIQQVYAYSLDGRRVVFPAKALHRIVTRGGVDGVFRLYYSDSGRFESIVAL